MTPQEYRKFQDALDDMLDWALDNNNIVRTQDEWDLAKAERLQLEFDKMGITFSITQP